MGCADANAANTFRMHARCLLLFALLGLGRTAAPAQEPAPEPLHPRHQVATVAAAKTSIYIGSVTLTMPPFQRNGDAYTSSYQAKVFPYFFYNESGTIAITLSDEDLRRIAAGEVVYFNGRAADAAGDPRRIEGRVVPDDAVSGKIKVRVWVSKNIELIFNTTYRFTGDATGE